MFAHKAVVRCVAGIVVVFGILCSVMSYMTLYADDAGQTITVSIGHEPQPFSWTVNGVNFGNDDNTLSARISALKGTNVIVKSEYKLGDSGVRKVRAIIRKANKTIKEFWVPVSYLIPESKRPGWVDLEQRSSRPAAEKP